MFLDLETKSRAGSTGGSREALWEILEEFDAVRSVLEETVRDEETPVPVS